MKEIKKDQKQQLLPIFKKYSIMFTWKTASLVIIFLIAIICITDFLLQIYLWAYPDPTANTSFFNDVVQSKEAFQDGQQASFLLTNMLKADPQIFFQRGSQIYRSEGQNFKKEDIKQKIFKQKSKDLLFIFEIEGINSGKKQKFGVFVVPDFPIPSDNSFNQSQTYYTFEFGIIRQSMAFNLKSSEYLVMNGGKDGSKGAIRNDLCKTYEFTYKNQQFDILSLFKINLAPPNDTQPHIQSRNITKDCFILSSGTPEDKLVKVIGINLKQQSAILNNVTVFHLYNEE